MIPRGVAGDKDKIMSAVCDYAIEGLRTLVIARRRITEAEFQEFDRQLNEAKLSLTDRDKRVRARTRACNPLMNYCLLNASVFIVLVLVLYSTVYCNVLYSYKYAVQCIASLLVLVLIL